MIGLGSNRLSVCRRGGMSVTQAGRGGMEWLGSRVPSWVTPYSAQATAALKSEYPQYWNQISDFGFNNPTLVPILNIAVLEDVRIMCSLIPEIGIRRYLSNTAGAYINTEYCPSSNTGFDVEFSLRLLGTRNVLGCREGWISKAFQLSNYTGHNASGTFYFGTHPYVARMNTLNIWQTHTLRNRVYVNGEGERATLTDEFTQSTKPIILFAAYLGDASRIMEFGELDMARCYLYEGETMVKMYVPFKKSDNTCGMIDLLTGTFKGLEGSGSFTISETPAS